MNTSTWSGFQLEALVLALQLWRPGQSGHLQHVNTMCEFERALFEAFGLN
jgi:hypothetical protein